MIMKITEKQLLILLDTLRSSLYFVEREKSIFTYDKKTRTNIYDEIINQQNQQTKIIDDE